MIIVIIDNYSGVVVGRRNHSFRQQYSANVMNGEKINNEKTRNRFLCAASDILTLAFYSVDVCDFEGNFKIFKNIEKFSPQK